MQEAPAGTKAQLGIPKLLSLTTLVTMFSLVLLSLLTAGFLLRDYFVRLPQIVFRDTAAFVANEFISKINQGREPTSVLTELETAFQISLASLSMLISDRDGRLLESSGTCPKTTRGEVVSSGQTLPVNLWKESLHARSPCRGDLHPISAISLQQPSGSSLYLFAEPKLSKFFLSGSGKRLMLRYGLPSIAILLAGALGYLLAFRFLFDRHIQKLKQEAAKFAAAKVTTPLSSTPVKELNRMSELFHILSSEEQRRNEELRRIEQDREEIFLGLLHDVRTPLTAIKLAAEQLSETDEGSKESILESVRNSAKNQLAYAQELEQLGELADPARVVAMQSFEPAALLPLVLEHLGPLAQKHRVQLRADSFYEADSGAESSLCWGEPTLILRALENLLGNAISYTPPEGTVILRLHLTPAHCEFVVRDSGPGIDPKDLGEIQERFVMGREQNTRHGFGLGLSIVQRIAEIHSGKLEIQSRIGSGTEIGLLIPRAEPINSQVPEENVHPERGGDVPRLSFPALTGLALVFASVTALGSGITWFAMLLFLVLALTASASLHPFFRSFCLHSLKYQGMIAAATYAFSGYAASVRPSLIISGIAGFTAVLSLGLLLLILFQSLQSSLGRFVRIGLSIFSLLTGISLTLWFGYGVATPSAPYLLGELAAIPILGVAILIDSTRGRSRISTLTKNSLFIFGTLAALISCLLLRNFVSAVLGETLTQEAQGIIASAEIEKIIAGADKLQVERWFSSLQNINPFIDFILYDSSGRALLSGGMQYAEGSFFAPESGSSSIGSVEGTQLASPFQSQSRVLWRKTTFEGKPAVLAAHAPSRAAEHIAGRLIQPLLAKYLAILSLGAALLLASSFAFLNSIIKARFSLIEDGLNRYRRREYQQPIGLRSQDALGDFVRHLDAIAGGIPLITGQIDEQRNRLHSFFLHIAKALQKASAQTLSSLSDLSKVNAGQAAKQVAREASEQRDSIEGILEIYRLAFTKKAPLREEIPIAEALLEELVEVKKCERLQGKTIVLTEKGSPRKFSGDGELVIELFRHFSELALAQSDQTEIVLEYQPRFGLHFHLSGVCLSAELKEYLYNPLTFQISRLSEPLPLGGYTTAALAKRCQAQGWEIEFVSIPARSETHGDTSVFINFGSQA